MSVGGASAGLQGQALAKRFTRLAHGRGVLLVQLLILGSVFTIWELGAGNPRDGALFDDFFTGRPSGIWKTLVSWASSGVMLRNVSVTLEEALIGFAAGSIAAMSAGFALSATRFGADVFNPIIFGLYSLPRVALAPLFILWFGLGMEPKIALVVLFVFFPIFFNTYQGAREVDDELIFICRLMRASRWQVFRNVILPSALVWVALGLKVSVPYAFVAAVIAELISGDLGIGALISKGVYTFNTNSIFAAVFMSAALAITLEAVIGKFVGHLSRWRQTSGGTG